MPGEPMEEVRTLGQSSKEKTLTECGLFSQEEESTGGCDYSLPAHSAYSICTCPALVLSPPKTGD